MYRWFPTSTDRRTAFGRRTLEKDRKSATETAISPRKFAKKDAGTSVVRCGQAQNQRVPLSIHSGPEGVLTLSHAARNRSKRNADEMEAPTGIEPVYTDLQSAASPLRHRAPRWCAARYQTVARCGQVLFSAPRIFPPGCEISPFERKYDRFRLPPGDQMTGILVTAPPGR